MKIERTEMPMYKEFEDIVEGNAFYLKGKEGKTLYLKTENIVDEKGQVFNAVALGSGRIFSFANNELVCFIPNAKIIC